MSTPIWSVRAIISFLFCFCLSIPRNYSHVPEGSNLFPGTATTVWTKKSVETRLSSRKTFRPGCRQRKRCDGHRSDDDDDDHHQPDYGMNRQTDCDHRTSDLRLACCCGAETTNRSPPTKPIRLTRTLIVEIINY